MISKFYIHVSIFHYTMKIPYFNASLISFLSKANTLAFTSESFVMAWMWGWMKIE
jgi:hypothetical protein